jgi:hypothetical protein
LLDAKGVQRLGGKLAYLRMLNGDQAAPLLAEFQQAQRARGGG